MQTSYSDEPTAKKSYDSLWLGLLFTLLLHLLQIPMGLMTEWLSFLLFGVSQLVYMLPAIIIAGILRRGLTAAGLAIGMGLSFLLGGVIIGMFCSSILK